jgi:tetratricopeptide (TPR) repeat protein
LGLISLIAGLVGLHLWALYHFRAGRAAVERYHNVEAARHLQACRRVWPKDGDVLLLLARVSRRVGVLDTARQYLGEYQRVRGPTADLALERVLQVAVEGGIDQVKQYCLDLVEQDSPAAPLVLEALVQGCLRTSRFAETYGLVQRWLERQPNNTQALLFQAELYTTLQRRDVIAIYQQILRLDSEHETARQGLAGVLMQFSMHQEAAPYLDQLQQEQPDNPSVLVLRARCLDYLAQRQEALQLLDRTLSKHPHFAPALAERGRLAMLDGQLAEAEPWLREAVAREPGDHKSRYQLALCLLQSGKLSEAEKEQKVLNNLELDLKRLRIILSKEIGQKPNDPRLHYELAMIMLKLGQSEEALHWLLKTLEKDPNYIPAHQVLVDYYQRIGDWERADHHRQFLPSGFPHPPLSPRGEGEGIPARAKP